MMYHIVYYPFGLAFSDLEKNSKTVVLLKIIDFHVIPYVFLIDIILMLNTRYDKH